MDKAISQAKKKYEYVLSDKEILHYAQLRERAIIGYDSNIADAEERGEKKGKIETAEEMIKNDEPLEKIVRYSKLTEEKIRQLAKTMSKEI